MRRPTCVTLFCLISTLCSTSPALADEKLALPASAFKVMAVLSNGYGDPDFKPDVEAARKGPSMKGSLPVYVAFAADGCFAGSFTDEDLQKLDFACRVDSGVWSRTHVFDEIKRSPQDFGVDTARPTVLVLAPSMLAANCKACTLGVMKANAQLEKLDMEAQVLEVDLSF